MKHGRQFRGSEMNVKRHQNRISSTRTNSSGQRFYQVSGRDPYMRNSAIILAALLTARPTLAAEQCLEVKPNLNIDPAMQPNYAKYADTALASCGSTVKSSSIVPATSGSPVIRANGP